MSRGLSPDELVAQLARRQHGVWSRRQAVDAGFTSKMVRTRLASGLWLQLDNAVYAHAACEPTWHRMVSAAIHAEPWAAASHQTAAVLHGIDGFRSSRPHVVIRPGANARGNLSVAHRACDTSVTMIGSIPATTLAQTFVDLSQSFGFRRVSDALQAMAIAKPALIDQVRTIYCRLAPKGGRNLRALRSMLETLDEEPVAESVLELVLHEVMNDPRIPPVRWQAPFPGQVPGAQRVDGLIPEWALVIEGDGRSWHARLDDFERDRRRDAEAAAAGLLTLRYTWSALRDRPDWVRETTIRAGSQRAPVAIPA